TARMNPRVVYAGPLVDWGTCLSRLATLRELEPDVHAFDTEPYFNGSSLLQRLDAKFTFAGPSFTKANAAFAAFCENIKPDIVWIDKGWWLWEATLDALRKRGAFL